MPHDRPLDDPTTHESAASIGPVDDQIPTRVVATTTISVNRRLGRGGLGDLKQGVIKTLDAVEEGSAAGASAGIDALKLPRIPTIRGRRGDGAAVLRQERPEGGEVGGLGGAGDTMVIARGQAATQHGADHVVHHEVGHNLDGGRGWARRPFIGSFIALLLGAGGGGFVAFIVAPERRQALREKLKDLIEVDVKVAAPGSRIVVYEPDSEMR
jgi:hypothetical protein